LGASGSWSGCISGVAAEFIDKIREDPSIHANVHATDFQVALFAGKAWWPSDPGTALSQGGNDMRLFAWSILLVTIAAALLACAPAGSPAQATAISAPVTATAQVTAKGTSNSQLGTIVTDGSGRTLYLFMRDERNKSNCTGSCTQTWPPLTATSPTGGDDIAANLLGTITRDDGSTQVTYNGKPLYHYGQDTQPGDTKGQNLSSVWFTVSVDGGPILSNASIKTSQSSLGAIVTDASGRTLYHFANDQGNTIACTDRCPQNWPPVRTIGAPVAGDGVTVSLLATVTRPDGSAQVAYNGKTLYYFANDEKPGDTKGQGLAGAWFVLSATGDDIKAAP
jgi:predicted lipoprotein with Yx(FWY)xxD motif